MASVQRHRSAVRLDPLERGAGDPGQPGIACAGSALGWARSPCRRWAVRSDRRPLRGAASYRLGGRVRRRSFARARSRRPVGLEPSIGTGALTAAADVSPASSSRSVLPAETRRSCSGRARRAERRRRGSRSCARRPPRRTFAQDVCAVGRGERPLPRIARGRADLESEHDRRGRGAAEQDRQRAREQPRADACEGEPDQGDAS